MGVEEVCVLAREHIGQDDPQVVQLVLAAAINVWDNTDPLWPVFVGPSSAGKSTLVELTANLQRELADDVTPAGLLGFRRSEDSTTVAGVLPRVGARGLIVISDLSTILSMSDHAQREVLFSYLRKVYDGSLTRHLASVPRPLHWEGRVVVIAACTSAIDNYNAYQGELGTRFVYLRFTVRDLDERLGRLRRDRHRIKQLAAVQESAARAVEGGVQRLGKLDITDDLHDLIEIAGEIAAYGRTSVPRDRNHQVVGTIETEESWRIRNQLRAVARAGLALGLTVTEVGSLCCRVARDSMPLGRRNVLAALQHGEVLPTSTLAKRPIASRSACHRLLEDMEVAGVIVRELVDRKDFWQIAPDFSELIPLVFNGKVTS